MRRRSLILVVALALALAPWVAAPADAKIFPYPTHVETLDNGLTVILVPMSSGGLLSYWTVVRTGSRDEYEPGHSGFAHFFEHMMFRGTERYPAEVYNELVTEIGADTNAYTTDDYTAYYLNIAAEDMETVMNLEADRFQNLAYPEEAFRTEAGAVYGEYRKNRANPFSVIREALREKAYDQHTYKHTTMGFVEDIQAMPEMYDYSLSFFSRYYRPENVVLLLVGDLEVDSTLAKVKEYYGEWKPGYVEPKIKTEPEQTAERRIDVTYEGRTLPILWTAYKVDAYAPDSRDMVAANLLGELAFGETSELYKKLVLDEQVVEFVAGQVNLNRDPGLFDVLSMIKDPAKVDYVMAEIDRTIEHFQNNPPDAKRLSELKSRLKYGFLMGLDTPSNVSNNLVPFIALTGGIEAIETGFETADSITPEDVQNAARKYLNSSRRTVGILKGAS